MRGWAAVDTMQALALGVDIGTVSVKLAASIPASFPLESRGSRSLNTVETPGGDDRVVVAGSRRARGRPLEALAAQIDELTAVFGSSCRVRLAVTGSVERKL